MTQPLPPAPAARSRKPSPAAARPRPQKPAAPAVAKNGGGMDVEAHSRLLRIIKTEAVVIAILAGILLLILPFSQPLYRYYARNPQNEVMPLVALTMPNMTNQAVLSWATTSVTEIMTIGFGDFEQKLMAQRPRFTPDGWDAFTKAFVRQKIGESFTKNQLVLTTVPSGVPVIVAQGVNAHHVYEWRVQMPVIMTYATNNNVTQREKNIIELTIIRVPADQNPAGIGIDSWSVNT